jgi:hypothetical protein
MFELPNANEVVWKYIKNWRLCIEAQRKIFNLTRGRDIIRKYAQRFPLTEEIILRYNETFNA